MCQVPQTGNNPESVALAVRLSLLSALVPSLWPGMSFSKTVGPAGDSLLHGQRSEKGPRFPVSPSVAGSQTMGNTVGPWGFKRRDGRELPHLRAWAPGSVPLAALLMPVLSFLRLSFYSGHSSFGMYCMMFLAVSLLPRVGLWDWPSPCLPWASVSPSVKGVGGGGDGWG